MIFPILCYTKEKGGNQMEIGDWVVAEDKIGFITYSNHTESTFRVKFGHRRAKPFARQEIQKVSDRLDKEVIYALQHYAVEINDKEWFYELGQQLQPSHPSR